MRLPSFDIFAYLIVCAQLAAPAAAGAQDFSAVQDTVDAAAGWDRIGGEWTDGCTYFADSDGDGRIDYRRRADPCGSFNHVVWFDRDGDGVFDDTGSEPMPVPVLVWRTLSREPGEPAPCFGPWRAWPGAQELGAGLTAELLTTGDLRHASHAYSTMPGGGYPIRFLPDGRLESDNFGVGGRWSIADPATLLITTRSATVAYVYRAACGTLAREVSFADGRVTMEIRLEDPGAG